MERKVTCGRHLFLAFMVNKKLSIFSQNLRLVTIRKLKTRTVSVTSGQIGPLIPFGYYDINHQQTCGAIPFNLTLLTMFM